MSAPDRMRGLAGTLILDAHDYARSRRPWLEARRLGLGASETAAVLGLSSFKSPLDVWLDKTSDAPIVDEAPSVAAQIGTDMEDQVARWTMREFPELGKIGPTPGLIAHEDEPVLLATLDRLLYPRGTTGAGPLGILEVKTTSRWNYEKNWVDGVPPGAIQVQVQQQLAVTGLERAWVACWIRDERPENSLREPYLIEADPAVHEQLIAYGAGWWHQYVEPRVMPPAMPVDAPVMNSLHVPHLDADPVEADRELVGIIADWLNAKQRVKDATDDQKAAEVAIKESMVRADANSIARDDGQLLVTWKRPAKPIAVFDGKKFREDHPDLAAPYTTEKLGAPTLRAVKGHDE